VKRRGSLPFSEGTEVAILANGNGGQDEDQKAFDELGQINGFHFRFLPGDVKICVQEVDTPSGNGSDGLRKPSSDGLK
jgi:hypothetical protein